MQASMSRLRFFLRLRRTLVVASDDDGRSVVRAASGITVIRSTLTPYLLAMSCREYSETVRMCVARARLRGTSVRKATRSQVGNVSRTCK
jgi:hypothetical protein